jgi:hypothetical protein
MLAAPAESLLATAVVPTAPARQHAGASPSPPLLLAMENKAGSMENKLKSMEVDVCGEAKFTGRQGCPLASRPPVLEEEVLAAAKEKVPGDIIVCRRMEVFAPDSESPELVPDSESLELLADVDVELVIVIHADAVVATTVVVVLRYNMRKEMKANQLQKESLEKEMMAYHC